MNIDIEDVQLQWRTCGADMEANESLSNFSLITKVLASTGR